MRHEEHKHTLQVANEAEFVSRSVLTPVLDFSKTAGIGEHQKRLLQYAPLILGRVEGAEPPTELRLANGERIPPNNFLDNLKSNIMDGGRIPYL